MKDWLQSLVNPSFMPHGHCYLWRPDILWTHVISDISIALSYFLIPTMLAILIKKRKEGVPHADIFWLFIAFIFLCGTTHLVSIVVVWSPVYEYQGWLKAITACVSVLTVVVLLPKLPSLIRLPGIEKAYLASQDELSALKQKQGQLEDMVSATLDRENRIIDLKKEVNQLLADQGKSPVYEV